MLFIMIFILIMGKNITKLPVWLARKAWASIQRINSFIQQRKAAELEWRKLNDPRYKYPDGSLPIGHPIFQGVVSIAGVPVQAYPLSRVRAARRGGSY